MKLKDACSLGKNKKQNYDKPKQCIERLTLLTEVHIVKAIIFPVVMYECESWTKKAEH